MRKTIYLPVFVIIKDTDEYYSAIDIANYNNHQDLMECLFNALELTTVEEIENSKEEVLKLYNYIVKTYRTNKDKFKYTPEEFFEWALDYAVV